MEQPSVVIITGDLPEAYDVLTMIFFVEEIRVEILSFNGYPRAYHEALDRIANRITQTAAQHGADAVINTTIDVVLYPAAIGQRPGDLVVYGTLVKRGAPTQAEGAVKGTPPVGGEVPARTQAESAAQGAPRAVGEVPEHAGMAETRAALVGSWSGTVLQPGQESYPATMTIEATDGGLRGTIAYPTLRCGGSVTLRQAQESKHTFTERIEYGRGRCVDGGIIRVALKPDGTLAWEWMFPDGRVGATATLSRT